MCNLVQTLTLTVELHFLIHCLNKRFFKFTVGALRTDLSEFQGQNFKVGGRISLFLHIGGRLCSLVRGMRHALPPR